MFSHLAQICWIFLFCAGSFARASNILPVEERFEILVRCEKGLEHRLRRERRRERKIAARDALRDAHEIRRDAGMLAREHAAGPPEARRDLVGDEEAAVPAREVVERLQVLVRQLARRPAGSRPFQR